MKIVRNRILAGIIFIAVLMANTNLTYAAPLSNGSEEAEDFVIYDSADDNSSLEGSVPEIPEDERNVDIESYEDLKTSDGTEEVSSQAIDESTADSFYGPYLEEIVAEPEERFFSSEEAEDNASLLSEYIEKYIRESIQGGEEKTEFTFRKAFAKRLTGINAAIHDYLKEQIILVASGERCSTVFEIPVEDLGLSKTMWSAEELGVDTVVKDNRITDEALELVYQKADYDLNQIINFLLAEMPYELYWYSKVDGVIARGCSVGAVWEGEAYQLCLKGSLQFQFAVSPEFAGPEEYTVAPVGQTIHSAIQTAQEIVEEYADVSDYEKLIGYRDEICSLTDYNYPAAEGAYVYGNPWQLIWVFDSDDSTRVVCEGYSKAFQYLCDLTDFNGNVSSRIMTGLLTSGESEGPHMWNVVTMDDGDNYLADITSCDSGAIGYPDLLFLRGFYSGSLETEYVFRCKGAEIIYTYDGDTEDLYENAERTLSEEDYVYDESILNGPVIIDQPDDLSAVVGDTVEFHVEAYGAKLSYQWQYQLPGKTEWNKCGLSGAKTSTVHVPVTAGRAGQGYRCVITDFNGRYVESDAAYLTVDSPLTIVRHPSPVTAEVGETVQFYVDAAGNKITYQWQYQLTGKTEWNKCGLSGAKSSTVTVPVTEARNGQSYRCIVTDQNGNSLESNPAKLTVRIPLTITSQPVSVTSDIGKTVLFSVKAKGSGLSYQWQYRLPGKTDWNKCGLSGAKTSTVTVPVTAGRAGQGYRCIITDTYGNHAESNAAVLTLQTVLTITKQPVSVNAFIGDTVTFHVEAEGTGLTYQWQYQLPGKTEWNKCGLSGAKTSTVAVPVTAGRNGQHYRCVVTDGSGKSVESESAGLALQTTHLSDDLNEYEELSYRKSGNGIEEVSFCYGKSVLGRDLIAWSISPQNNTRTILLNFEIHGWEDSYAADGQLLVNLGNAVVSHYYGASNLNETRLIVIPSCNPDGLAEGTTNNGFGRCNADGIDLNRDFDVAYQSYSTERNYTPYPFSGKESAALRDLFLAVRPDIAIDFHGWENCTIGNGDLAEVFSLYCGLNHKREFSTGAHGYFSYWTEKQGAKGLLVEFKSPADIDQSKVCNALDKLIAKEYGTESSISVDAVYQPFCPIITYANSSGKIYTQQDIGNTGTSFGYIDGAEDQCSIIQVYQNGWCKVRYPVASYTKTGFCSFSAFIEERLKVSPYQATVVNNTAVYTTTDASKKLGSVWSSDTFTVVAESGDMVQIIYPLDTGGYKMGWIDKKNIKDLQ